MRVSIKHATVRKGFILKTTYYEVRLQVAFTHEEKQIIEQRKLRETRLLRRRPADAKFGAREDDFELQVGDLMNQKVDRFLLATPSQSKIYEEQLLDALAQLKLWLQDNAKTASGTVIEF